MSILKILILTNIFDGLYKFRRELVEKLAKESELVCVLPDDPKKDWFRKINAKYIEIVMDRRGMNALSYYKLFRTYQNTLRQEKPDVVLHTR